MASRAIRTGRRSIPTIVRFPGQSDDAVGDALQHGAPLGSVWRPAEVDVSIGPGWFYHPAQDSAVRTVDNLVQLYFTSVGRNAKLLLNVPPTRDGLLHETDVARLVGLHEPARRHALVEHSAEPDRAGAAPSERTAVAEWSLRDGAAPAVIRLGEDIARGQRVARYTRRREVTDRAGGPSLLARRSATASWSAWNPARRSGSVRLRVEDAVAPPEPVRVELFGAV